MVRKRWIVLIIALIVVVVGGFFYWASSRTSDGLRQVLAVRREAGEPLTFAEIQAIRAPITGEGETVADVVSRIAKAVVAAPGPRSRGVLWLSDGPGVDFFTGIPKDAIEPSRKYLAARRSAMQGLDAIADLEPGRFGISYEEAAMTAYQMQRPQFQRIADLLSLEATLQLIDGEIEAAAEHIPLFFRIVSPLLDEPNVLAQMERGSTVRRAASIVESILRVGTLSDDTLAQMDREFLRFLAAYTLKWSLWGERASFLATYDEFLGSPGLAGLPRAALSIGLSGDKRKGIEFVNSLIDVGDDAAGLLRVADSIETDGAALSKRHLMASYIATGLPNSVRSHVKSLAELRAIRVLIAAERFRLRNETMPTSLDEFVSTYIDAIPTDPFDRSPLRLTNRDGMLIVHSIGKDGVDDGGRVTPVKGEKRARDRGFRLLPVADRGVVFRD